MNKIKVKLKDVVTVVNGSTPSTANPEFYDGEIIWITPKDISTQNNKYIRYGERSITKEGLSSCSASIVPKGSVLMSSRAPIGLLSIAEIDLCTNQGFKNFIPDKDKIESEYLYYYLKTKIDDINKLGSGTTFKEVSKTSIENFEILIPNNISDQSRISKVLSSLDSKIALNNRINVELEAMAKTVYDYWFVQFDFPFDFAQGKPSAEGKPYKSSGGKMVWSEELKREVPEGWEVKNLGEVATIKAGGDKPAVISSEKTNECPIPIYSNGIVNNGLYGYTNKAIINSQSITISARGTIGFCVLRNNPYVPIIRLISLTPNCIGSTKYFYEALKNFNFENSGSVQQQLTVPQVQNIKILYPNENVLINFDKITSPMINKMEMIAEENQQLSSLRDWLLPMLMNGQVKVGEVEAEVLRAAEPGAEYRK